MTSETLEYQRLNPEDTLRPLGGRKHLEWQKSWYSRWHTVKMDEKVERENEEYIKRKHGSNDK